jgi:hypothetical protein
VSWTRDVTNLIQISGSVNWNGACQSTVGLKTERSWAVETKIRESAQLVDAGQGELWAGSTIAFFWGAASAF